MTKLTGICLAIGLLATLGCSSADSDWTQAQSAGTIAAYQGFVTAHPNDQRVAQAQQQIHMIQDEQAWGDAQKADTSAAFQQYIQAQPNGAHLEAARARVAELERAAAWKVAQNQGSDSALKQFLQQYGQGPEADQARAKLAQLDHYRVELASYRSKAAAEKDRSKLQAKYGKVVPGVIVVSSSKKSNDIDSTAMSLADAKSTCASLSKEHQHCRVLTL
jgi:hypothetical protein